MNASAAAGPQRTPTTGPRYLQIADDLRIDIETGKLKPGDPLPSVGQLAEQYDVSTAVTRQAIQLLRAQNLIVTANGRRPVVRGTRPKTVYSNDKHWEKRERISWPEEKRRNHGTLEDESGISIHGQQSSAVYTRTEANPRETPEWPEGTPILRREYSTTDRNGHWLARTTSYLPLYAIESNPDLLDDSKEPWPGGIHHQLSTVGIFFGRFEDLVTVKVPTTVESERWGMSPGEPLIEMRSIGWDENDLDGQPVFVNVIWYPAETTALHFITDVPRQR